MSPRSSSSAASVPDGYAAIPIDSRQAAAPLRICVLARREPDAIGGRLVRLRDTLDTRVHLGCLVDAGGTVHRWLEIWTQDGRDLSGIPAVLRGRLTQETLDERWAERLAALESVAREHLLETGSERTRPLPTWLDVDAGEPIHPVSTETGAPWRLCDDEELLARHDLPPYGSTLHRYLVSVGDDGTALFAAVTPEAPTSDAVRPLAEVAGDGRLEPLNPGAGLVLAREFPPLGLEAFIDLLSGRAWRGVRHGDTELRLHGSVSHSTTDDPHHESEGRIFLGRHGKRGRFVETLHLKLCLLRELVATVRDAVEATGRPVLGLRPESFRVTLSDTATRLPSFWTARPQLVDPGDTLTIPIPGTSACCWFPGREEASVYRPRSAQAPVSGTGAVRMRKVEPATAGRFEIHGTLSTQERFRVGRSDLLWLRLPLGGGHLDLSGHLESDTALAAGEWRFRSLPTLVDDAIASSLAAAQGVVLENVAFEFLPMISTPYDLYALGALAARVLLVGSRRALPEVIDELLSLARAVAEAHDASRPLAARIEAILSPGSPWDELVGPQHLTEDGWSVEEAYDLVTRELWAEVLAVIVRTFPGAGPDSTAADLGDARPESPHTVFDDALLALDDIVLKTRSLVVVDWRWNREIHAVIRSFRVG